MSPSSQSERPTFIGFAIAPRFHRRGVFRAKSHRKLPPAREQFSSDLAIGRQKVDKLYPRDGLRVGIQSAHYHAARGATALPAYSLTICDSTPGAFRSWLRCKPGTHEIVLSSLRSRGGYYAVSALARSSCCFPGCHCAHAQLRGGIGAVGRGQCAHPCRLRPMIAMPGPI